jgi:hypothetical protein
MENERYKLLRDLERYRFLLSANTDARMDEVIREFIAEAEARLSELNGKRHRLADQQVEASDRLRGAKGPAPR